MAEFFKLDVRRVASRRTCRLICGGRGVFGDGLSISDWSVFEILTRLNSFKSILTAVSGSVKAADESDSAMESFSFKDVLDFAAAVIASNSVTSAVMVNDWLANLMTSPTSANRPYKVISAKINLDSKSAGISIEVLMVKDNS